MSRTDHHRPRWVRENDSLELRYFAHHCHWRHRRYAGCVVGPRYGRSDERGEDITCGWQLDAKHWSSNAPKWYRDHVYINPARTHEREVLTEARKEWNGSGHTDLEPEPRQHRHGAAWLYW